jgi:hypothetical protein
MSEVSNAGRKGRIVAFGIIAFLLFIILVVYIYYANQRGVPVVL